MREARRVCMFVTVTSSPRVTTGPFLYLHDRHIPGHYLTVLGLILVVSTMVVFLVVRGQAGKRSWGFFLLGVGFMLLETRSITQLALFWDRLGLSRLSRSRPSSRLASAANYVVSEIEIIRPWLVGAVLVFLLGLNVFIPVGTLTFENLALESLFYAVLMFNPILCAGQLFGSSVKHSTSLPRDYGTNLLGAMVGRVSEYLSLVTGFGFLLLALLYRGDRYDAAFLSAWPLNGRASARESRHRAYCGAEMFTIATPPGMRNT